MESNEGKRWLAHGKIFKSRETCRDFERDIQKCLDEAE